MPIDDRVAAWAALAQRQLPQRALVLLLRHFGGPGPVLDATRAQLAAVVAAPLVERVLSTPDAERAAVTAAWLADPAHHLIAWDDDDYPKALLDVGDAPPVLFFVGRRELLNRPALAIVGSRNATAQGCDNAREFARALSTAGWVIVSGLALGIDGAAHEGALEAAGSTLAVVGTGLDRIYPARHRTLGHRIAIDGGLLSEFLPGTPAQKENFPRRNRLLSGLSRGVLVVEASLSSGSLITARLAGEQGRDVFAIPGSIHSPLSRGCHKLIREGAKLVETAQDVLAELGGAPRADAAAGAGDAAASERAAAALDRDAAALDLDAAAPDDREAALLDALGHDPASVDDLVLRAALPAEAVIARLTALELSGRVARVGGGRWQRRARHD